MSENEKLIEATGILRQWREHMDADVEDAIETVLAVFEKAHTPTDDEREALRQEFEYRTRTAVAYGKGVQKWGQLTEKTQTEWIDEQIALAMNSRAVSGFRRSEVPEPSAPRCAEGGGHIHVAWCYMQGEPSDAQAAEEADRRWPHTPGDLDTASARSARRLSFRQGVEWARAAGGVR